MNQGDALAALEKEITQERLAHYAEASGDFNPIHLDNEFAAKTQFGGTIAHGMLLLGYLSEAMTHAFGERWVSTGKMRVRFREAARPGDHVTVTGRVRSIQETEAGSLVTCVLEGHNQREQLLISGEGAVLIR